MNNTPVTLSKILDSQIVKTKNQRVSPCNKRKKGENTKLKEYFDEVIPQTTSRRRYSIHGHYWVISREITPLTVLYQPLYKKKVLYRASISSFTLDLRSRWSPGAVYSSISIVSVYNIYMGGGGV